MLPETNTRRDTGLDSARAFALLLMLIPVSVSLNLVPGKHLSWLSQVLPQALNLFAVILGAAAYLYSRKVAFPQFFASSIVRFLAFCVLGWILAQFPHSTFADQAFSGWKDFPIRFDMLLPLAVLTLLSIGLVYMPFWVQLAVTVLASPAVPFTYERLSVGGWTADDWLHRTIPAIVNESAGTMFQDGFKLIWLMGLGMVLWRGYEKLGARLGIPAALGSLAVSIYLWVYPHAQLGPLTWPIVLTIVGVVGTVCTWGEFARLSAGKGVLEPFARLGRMSLSASIMMLGLAFYCGGRLVTMVAGEGYRAPQQGSVYSYALWFGFLLVWWVLAMMLCTLWEKIQQRGPLEMALALMSGRG